MKDRPASATAAPRPLTAKQRAVLQHMVDGVERDGAPPTVRDVQARLGLASVHGAHRHLRALARWGYIALPAGGTARACRILRLPDGRKIAGFAAKAEG